MKRLLGLPEPAVLSRRSFLQGSGALLGGCLLTPVATWAASPTLALDFRGSLPSAVSYRRASPASLADGAQLRTLPAHAPRFPLRRGRRSAC
ncbi:twin-arginine translocation signal domain-containing protein [Dechloromonas sp. A34]|uniref:twin-arginine translocation signal domain-containing protein n=1 Tax=Dechloromonas sp. A34 TaxID=447588 RepID=UPI002248B2E1|nr:twin-arginine translocation signal domain-containing protein [Dechloromonas sp. A34]